MMQCGLYRLREMVLQEACIVHCHNLKQQPEVTACSQASKLRNDAIKQAQ